MATKTERPGIASLASLKKKLKDAEQHVSAMKDQLREAKSAAKRAKKELKRAKRATKNASANAAPKKAAKSKNVRAARKKTRIAGTPEISTPAVAKQRQKIARIVSKRTRKSPAPAENVSTAPAPDATEVVTSET